MLHELVYTSVATLRNVPQASLEDILAASRRNNLRLDITGVLFYADGGFVQLLEGPRQAVRDMYYNVIAHDLRHRRLFVCWENHLPTRNFADWQMGFARPETLPPQVSEEAGYLANGIDSLDLTSPASTGRRLLLSIYNSMRYQR